MCEWRCRLGVLAGPSASSCVCGCKVRSPICVCQPLIPASSGSWAWKEASIASPPNPPCSQLQPCLVTLSELPLQGGSNPRKVSYYFTNLIQSSRMPCTALSFLFLSLPFLSFLSFPSLPLPLFCSLPFPFHPVLSCPPLPSSNFPSFFLFFLSPFLLRDYSPLCAQRWLLVVLRGTVHCLGLNLGLLHSKPVLSSLGALSRLLFLDATLGCCLC